MIQIISYTGLALSAISALLIVTNLFLFRRLPDLPGNYGPAISVLIPARDEAANIAAVVHSVLASEDADFEVLVMDDGSQDATAEIVTKIAEKNRRVKLLHAPKLETGWVGKPHCCYQLSRHARFPVLLFIDADVRLRKDALRRVSASMKNNKYKLLSGFPKQVTVSFAEKLIIPLIHFLLLGYLPILAMRKSGWAAFAAGCGQFIAVDRKAYQAVGGHRMIPESMHDGLTLPHVFRRKNYVTDIFDAGDIAECRMYDSLNSVWLGFKKNATEGMAKVLALPVWTILLAGGHLAAFIALPWLLIKGTDHSEILLCLAIACALSIFQRGLLVLRFSQSWLGALMHPLGVAFVLMIQWSALFGKALGKPSGWRGRSYVSGA